MTGTLRLTGVKADGTPFPVEASISPVEAMGKRYSTVILRDISLRLQAEQQEKQLNEELNRQNQQFGYITSHTLRGPVATILGLLNVLDKDNRATRQRRHHRYLTETPPASTASSTTWWCARLPEEIPGHLRAGGAGRRAATRLPCTEAANARIVADLDGVPKSGRCGLHPEHFLTTCSATPSNTAVPKREPLVRITAKVENGWVILTFADKPGH
jgi:hypothetical protein